MSVETGSVETGSVETGSVETDSIKPDIAHEIALAKQLLNAGKFNEAIATLESLLQPADDLPSTDFQDVLYVLAVCHRYNNSPIALTVLERLLSLFPNYGRAYQERGHIYRKQGRSDDAVKAYEEAVRHNPALVASWKHLAALYHNLNEDRGTFCRKRVENLSRLPPELLSVTSMIHEGKLYEAEQLCRAFVQKNRQHIEAMRLLAQIATQLNVLDDADFLLDSCVTFAPEYLAARYDYAQVLFMRARFQQSLEQAEVLLKHQPDNPAFRLTYANAAVPVGEIKKALEYYQQLIDESPEHIQYHMLKGHALKTLGEQSLAVAAYRKAANIRADHGDAYWSLANLKTYRFASDEVAQMKRAEANDTVAVQDRYQLCFSLGKHFEDSEAYTEAFEYYERGNRLKKEQSGYRADKTELEFFRMREVCSEKFFAERQGYGVADRDPIFVVGLPRSGSTLLEQVLASHPLVDGTIELPNILSLAHKLGGRRRVDEDSRYPAILQDFKPEQFKRFGQEYLASTGVYRQGAPYFTDKMPNNFRHIGLIQLMFPNAKIVDARRNPMACCFSNFKQLFGEGQEFSYGLEEVGRYYRAYVDMMNHWNQVLPGKVLRVQYENVVEDLESQVRRLLAFLELPFDHRCIDFHKNERAVHTPSAEQVRQPIFKTGIEQWKRFEPYLSPLKEALGDSLLN